MKKLTLFATVILALFFNSDLQSQNWGNFGPLLSQLDSANRVEYLNNLYQLDGNTGLNNQQFGSAMDSLNAASNGTNPASGVANLVPSGVRDSLKRFLDVKNFAILDSFTVIGQFDTLNQFWGNNSGNINSLFGTFENNLNGINQVPTTYTSTNTTQWELGQDSLAYNQLVSTSVTAPNGVKNFKALFNTLFNPSYFTSLEMYAGMQNANVRYYTFLYDARTPVIGVRTSEQFNRTWEPRWRGQGSWFATSKSIVSNEGVAATIQKNAPFMFNGGFDMMFNPAILPLPGSITGQLRLISILGIDASIYAPAHKASSGIRANNKGFTVGWGPVIGGGMALKSGTTTIYGLSTITFGQVKSTGIDANANYDYNSARIEAGIRYQNNISLRFEQGFSNRWAAGTNKNVRYTQVTVGLPTTGLFRR
jgi:hypothetical protein